MGRLTISHDMSAAAYEFKIQRLIRQASRLWLSQKARLSSNKTGGNSKCFAERRLQVLSPEISLLLVPKLYRPVFLPAINKEMKISRM
jgi:hypothetical protein